MNTSFYNGVAGMKAHQNAIDLLSDNISNVNTPGFRSSSAEFSTIYSNELASLDTLSDPTSNTVGYGSIFSATSTNFSQGALIDGGSIYDLAIEGDGFFGVKNSKGEEFFTRSGNFNKDANGLLVDSQGNAVMVIDAHNIDQDGISVIKQPNKVIKAQTAGKQTPIKLPTTLTYPAQASTFVKFSGSIDATKKEEFKPDGTRNLDPHSEKFQAEVQDAKGNTNLLTLTLTISKDQTVGSTKWDSIAQISDRDGNVLSKESGVVIFDGKGGLKSNTLTSIDNNGSPLKIDLGSGFDGVMQTVNGGNRSVKKDGIPFGELVDDYVIDDKGLIIASFSNGENVPIAKIPIYHFRNEGGLEKVGNTTYKATQNSGKPIFFIDKKGNNIDSSKIQSRKLELSNVDLTTALTELIAMQKAFDASSKSITTSDQLIQNAINMKK